LNYSVPDESAFWETSQILSKLRTMMSIWMLSKQDIYANLDLFEEVLEAPWS
jgi:hypothetical protein